MKMKAGDVMDKKVTMEQIAEAANVSKGLVSRALTDRYGVSSEMRSLIKMKAVELGYDFERIKTKSKKRMSCCLLMSSRVLTRESYWQPIIRSMEEALSFEGIDTDYFIYDETDFSEEDSRRLKSNDAGAYVIMHKNFPFLMRELEKKHKPTVVIDPQFHMAAKFLQIRASNYESSFEAAQYLIENGLRRLVYYGACAFSQSYRERYEGARDCVQEYAQLGATLESVDIDNSDYAFGAPEQLTAVIGDGHVDAVLCCNDLFAISALKTIKELGLNVPEDISLVGFDNTIESSIVSPEITTVDIPREAMGKEAARFVVDTAATGKANYTSLVLNCTLVKRRSVKTIPQNEEAR